MMSHELEDVIVLDPGERKIYNFSDIVPASLKKEELTHNLDALLKDGQVRLCVEYLDEEEEEVCQKRISEDGGTYLRSLYKKPRDLLSLPLHRYRTKLH